ncbi:MULTISPECIES: hypothetical protein [unclassified Microcoleus]|uniref:hypothetical protein n=1 Tax=unclassified Microcoleus TaxID=2642155 RepID=UPI001D980ADE|nr:MULTISPECIES: hypothetical protein [unclassified Microcoleus]MCC3595801.1 hypothetical protein [Microcoleus sp. PH2017_26_ELK_O_A]MCC3620603.1 hypothetical protein [Microcoleus sp. PH2017_36_ELK_O_B]
MIDVLQRCELEYCDRAATNLTFGLLSDRSAVFLRSMSCNGASSNIAIALPLI